MSRCLNGRALHSDHTLAAIWGVTFPRARSGIITPVCWAGRTIGETMTVKMSRECPTMPTLKALFMPSGPYGHNSSVLAKCFRTRITKFIFYRIVLFVMALIVKYASSISRKNNLKKGVADPPHGCLTPTSCIPGSKSRFFALAAACVDNGRSLWWLFTLIKGVPAISLEFLTRCQKMDGVGEFFRHCLEPLSHAGNGVVSVPWDRGGVFIFPNLRVITNGHASSACPSLTCRIPWFRLFGLGLFVIFFKFRAQYSICSLTLSIRRCVIIVRQKSFGQPQSFRVVAIHRRNRAGYPGWFYPQAGRGSYRNPGWTAQENSPIRYAPLFFPACTVRS